MVRPVSAVLSERKRDAAICRLFVTGKTSRIFVEIEKEKTRTACFL